MFNSPIKSKVMKVINARLDKADKDYKKSCDEIDRDAEGKKISLADKMVQDLIGKIIQE